jgi:excisionase family DNA binding protein
MTDLPAKQLLRPDEVAAFWSVSVKTIYRWIDMGILPAIKKGGTIRVPRDKAENGKPVME